MGIAIGTLEKINKGLNNYVEFAVTHFIIYFIGLNNSALKFKSKLIKKRQHSIMVLQINVKLQYDLYFSIH